MLRTYLAIQNSWNFPLLVVLSLVVFCYFLLIKYHKQIHASMLQQILFFTGIALLFAMIGSPLLSLSYLSFSLHMVQMSIIFFIIPPFILLGVPKFNIDFKNKNRLLQKIHVPPMYALIAFAILFLLYHLPVVLTFISQNDFLQKFYLVILFLLAFIMCFPIASIRSKFPDYKQKKYSQLSGILIMPACLLFIVSALMQSMDNPFMSDIAAHLCLPAQSLQILPVPFNTKYDQMLSGVLMISIHKLGIVVTSKLHSHL